MKIAILIVVGQGVMWFLAWRAWTSGGSRPNPEDVLKGIVFCFFFWWLVVPIHGLFALNEWTTAYVTCRRARLAHKPATSRSGQDNGLYE